jgi:hypothetical protein
MPEKQWARRQTGKMTEEARVATRSLYDVGRSYTRRTWNTGSSVRPRGQGHRQQREAKGTRLILSCG